MSPLKFYLLLRFGFIPLALVQNWAARHQRNPLAELRQIWRHYRPRLAVSCCAFIALILLNVGLYYWGNAASAVSALLYFGGNAGLITFSLVMFTDRVTLSYDFSTNGIGRDLAELLYRLNISVWDLRKQSSTSLRALSTEILKRRAREIVLTQEQDRGAPSPSDSSSIDLAKCALKWSYDAVANFQLNEGRGYGMYFT